MESQWVPQEAAQAVVGLGDSQWRAWRRRVKRTQGRDDPPLEREVEGKAHRTEIDLPWWLLAFTQLLRAESRGGAAAGEQDELLGEDEEDEGWQALCYREKYKDLKRKNEVAEKLLLPVAEVQTVLVVAAGGLRMIADEFCDECRERYTAGLGRVDEQIEALLADGGDAGETAGEGEAEADDGADGPAGGGESGADSGAGGAAAAGAEPA
jgi:hypothetical protein